MITQTRPPVKSCGLTHLSALPIISFLTMLKAWHCKHYRVAPTRPTTPRWLTVILPKHGPSFTRITLPKVVTSRMVRPATSTILMTAQRMESGMWSFTSMWKRSQPLPTLSVQQGNIRLAAKVHIRLSGLNVRHHCIKACKRCDCSRSHLLEFTAVDHQNILLSSFHRLMLHQQFVEVKTAHAILNTHPCR